jgi:hypothetical protein
LPFTFPAETPVGGTGIFGAHVVAVDGGASGDAIDVFEFTVVALGFVTVAAKFSVSPSNTVPLAGVPANCTCPNHAFHFEALSHDRFHFDFFRPSVDFPCLPSNNPPMPRPNAVRRVKSYSAANGYVYQYCFYEVNRITHNGGPAGEFIYAISADRKTTFGLRIVVQQSALEAWAQANGRSLTSSEEYAVAKMRLFQAFDEDGAPLTAETAAQASLLVDESNLESLLAGLNI